MRRRGSIGTREWATVKYASRWFDRDDIAPVSQADERPVFQQPWWLAIALSSRPYRELNVVEDGVEQGNLLYTAGRNKIGIRWGYSPYWSHLGGPLVDSALSEDRKRHVLQRLIAQLPRNIYFRFVCNPRAADAALVKEAFAQAGFSHSTQKTYSCPADDPGVRGRLNKKHHKHLRAAEARLDIVEIDAQAFVAFYRSNLKAAGKKSYAPLAIAQNLIAAGTTRDPPQIRVLAARPKLGFHRHETLLDAAIACAWDHQRYYLWMMTHRRTAKNLDNKPHPDAIKLLIVKATEHARNLGLTFDVDGSNTLGSERLYKEILKIPCVEYRDVYERATGLSRLLLIFLKPLVSRWL
jgi:hypothetical protein